MPEYPEQLYGIVGHPVGHSLSPALHNWGFAQQSLPGVYMAWDTYIPDLPAFISSVRALPISGASVTIPHKEAIMPLLDKLTPTAARIGAVNTLYWQGGSLVGDNTDMEGFLYPLGDTAPPAALVLGGGGASRAVLAGLEKLGTPNVIVAARTVPKALPLQKDFNCRVIPWENRTDALRDMGQGLVVNTTPMGMHGTSSHESPLPKNAWPRAEEGGYYTVYDIIYNPLETVFLKQARSNGWSGLNGLDFFIAQGLAQFRLWTGRELPFAEARSVLKAALERRLSEEGQPA